MTHETNRSPKSIKIDAKIIIGKNRTLGYCVYFNKSSVIQEELLMCFTGGTRSEMKVLKAEISSLVLPTLNLFFSSHFLYCLGNSCISLAFWFHYVIPLPCCAINFKILKFKDIGCVNSYLCMNKLWT